MAIEQLLSPFIIPSTAVGTGTVSHAGTQAVSQRRSHSPSEPPRGARLATRLVQRHFLPTRIKHPRLNNSGVAVDMSRSPGGAAS